jgi:1-acyl-sn-glycerol-3-phosphate acyltransferase
MNPWMEKLIRPVRLRRQRSEERIAAVEVRGLDHLRQALDRGWGVLVTANHADHSDPFVFLHVQDRLRRLFYYMVAWQSFQILRPFARRVLQWHGCFSVDREGTDLRAFRQAVEIVQTAPHPLVVFAEGEVYHHADQVAPFRTGAVGIALAAARRATRPIVCIPAAIQYRYLHDPTPELERLTTAFERRLHELPRPELPLAERLYRLAERLVELHELRYRACAQPGTFRSRVNALLEFILRQVETRHGIAGPEGDVPDRVTRLRRLAIKEKESWPAKDARHQQAARDLDDLYVVTQLYSYADDYEQGTPTWEHLGEIADKFQEDILHVMTARPMAARRAFIRFGEPIEVRAPRARREDPRPLTDLLVQRVRQLMEDIRGTRRPGRDTVTSFAAERHDRVQA